jgi:hypothetical protein
MQQSPFEKKLPHFAETEDLLPCPQKPTRTCTYPEPDLSSLQQLIVWPGIGQSVQRLITRLTFQDRAPVGGDIVPTGPADQLTPLQLITFLFPRGNAAMVWR